MRGTLTNFSQCFVIKTRDHQVHTCVHGPLAKCSEETRQGRDLQLKVKEERVWENGEYIRESRNAEPLKLARIKFPHRSLVPVRAREGFVMNDDGDPITGEAQIKFDAI